MKNVEYDFSIDACSPDTLPMKRLADYIKQLADLYGSHDQVSRPLPSYSAKSPTPGGAGSDRVVRPARPPLIFEAARKALDRWR